MHSFGYGFQLATNIGNQMTNCFATDACDDTGDTWEENGVGTGIGVSPDDLTSWDRCAKTGTGGGTYGYNEPAVYLGAAFRHKYTWTPSAGDGSYTITVKDDGNPAQDISGATILVDGDPKGTTGADGTLHIANQPAGPHVIEAEKYSGPPLIPLILSPTPEQILEMADCPAAGPPWPSECKATRCPSGWTTSTTSAIVPVPSTEVVDEVAYVYACYPPVQPPPGCDLLTSEPRTASVIQDQDVSVLLTLCAGAACNDGVRDSCLQNCPCADDSTVCSLISCDNNQVCKGHKCVVAPRLVKISDPGILGIVSGGCSCDQAPNAFANLDLTCDPTQFTNYTDWLCDASHLQFCTSPITAGVVDKPYELSGNGDCNTLNFHIVCTMDPRGSGGVIVGTDMRLWDGCGDGAEDEANARQWSVVLVPATPSNPSPSVACTGDPTTTPSGTCCGTPVGSPACGGFGPAACYHDGINACSACCDNEGSIGNAITYTSVPR